MNVRKPRTSNSWSMKNLIVGALVSAVALTLFVNTYQVALRGTSFILNPSKKEKDHANNSVPYAIFYNAYVNPDNIYHSLGVITEQLAQWQASRHANATLYYTHLGDASIPFPCPKKGDCELLMQQDTGRQEDTLAKLYEYCQEHPEHNVIYLHSKGSFRVNEESNRLRNLVTLSALSEECVEGLNNMQCNICSARFSPLPHWHTPGNMWSVKCSYVEKLYPILVFEAKEAELAEQFLKDCPGCIDWSVGTGQYANHWVYTHPLVNPCDVFPDLHFVYGYPTRVTAWPPFDIKKAPRSFPDTKNVHFMDPPPGPQIRLKYKLSELWRLYQATPANDSFVWTWYKDEDLL